MKVSDVSFQFDQYPFGIQHPRDTEAPVPSVGDICHVDGWLLKVDRREFYYIGEIKAPSPGAAKTQQDLLSVTCNVFCTVLRTPEDD